MSIVLNEKLPAGDRMWIRWHEIIVFRVCLYNTAWNVNMVFASIWFNNGFCCTIGRFTWSFHLNNLRFLNFSQEFYNCATITSMEHVMKGTTRTEGLNFETLYNLENMVPQCFLWMKRFVMGARVYLPLPLHKCVYFMFKKIWKGSTTQWNLRCIALSYFLAYAHWILGLALRWEFLCWNATSFFLLVWA